MRKAGHFFSQTSGGGNWRIVIIDPADDLNRNGANAILKILEEPPKRALFLVLSHAPGRLLPTIRSRCMPLRLTPLDDQAMRDALLNLGFSFRSAEEERAVLSVADGSVSRALKIINYGGLEIIGAFDRAVGAEGPGRRMALHKLADSLSGRDSDAAFQFFVEHVGDYLKAQARSAALEGRLDRANHFAGLTSAIDERLTIAAAYNLDRKQTILDVMEDVAG